ncbi:lysylphosphatidylglycerol synthase transmembrane domain-containing protein [uncultured Corynebacterium sp.]|uniref:lysylphosphatidylglycerol synthase transmembrane domain-containing protein n=1 Tax=uncultured Corynebacterium sp. TaxID=159447 RepID=UPI0025F03D01|nr:lysylphosphatidylglycerol synthase transmembrane domain-containing protein [uncultured Corynebacterium sp.]
MTDARAWIRWLAPVVVLVIIGVVFRDQLPFLGEAFQALRHARPAPVAAAVACAVLAIVAMAAVMRILLTKDGVRVNMANTTAITLASNAWSTTIPGGPALSAWLTFNVHRSWGASVGLCGWFFVISGALSTVWMVVIGIAAVIFLGAHLSVLALAGSLTVAVGAIAGVFWAIYNPDVLRRWVRFLPEKVRGKVEEVIDQLSSIRMTPGAFLAAATFSLLNQLIDVATLYFSVTAVTGALPGLSAGLNETTIQGVALAFIMTKLAGAAQVTPGGIGTVEPVATASLVASGLTLVDATAATLIYRIISFALITAIGWIIYLLAYAGKGFMLGRPD